MNREALINLANHIDVARMQANDIPETAYMTPVYTDLAHALRRVVRVLVEDSDERAETVYQSILDGNPAERALEWEAGEREKVAAGPRFPDVEVQLSEQDGNAFFIIGRISLALRRAGHGDVVNEFQTEAMSGDYDHVLQTCMRWVVVF